MLGHTAWIKGDNHGEWLISDSQSAYVWCEEDCNVSSAFYTQVTCGSSAAGLVQAVWHVRQARRQKVNIIPEGPQTFMSSLAHVALQSPVRFHCVILFSVSACSVQMNLSIYLSINH